MNKARHYRGGYQSAGARERTRELRAKQTPAEALLWQRLRNKQFLGMKFRRQHQYGGFILDFYCYEAGLVIECDGEVHSQNQQWHHDQRRSAYLIASGLRVLRFTNDQILNDIEYVLTTISSIWAAHRGEAGSVRGPFSLNPSPQPSPKGRGR